MISTNNDIELLYIPEVLGIERNLSSLKKVYNQLQLNMLLRPIIVKNNEFISNVCGKTVLIKPNWVIHPEKPADDFCLIIHHEVLFAVLGIILEIKPKRVIIGDAPIQRCKWDKLLTESFFKRVDELRKQYETQIEIVDFRRTFWDKEIGIISEQRRPISDYIIFNAGSKSNLEPISKNKNIFRVTDYDPRLLGKSHQKGVHKYCLTKVLFEADTILTISKFKTHQKTGVTNAVKTIVGFNGDKDYLPHHRIGGSIRGGDCYPGNNPIRRVSEFFLDMANINRHNMFYSFFKKISKAAWKSAKKSNYHNLEAGWFGNDTTWRMVLDLYNIVLCGNLNGRLEPVPVRKIYNITDGIIGGEGDGPLKPEPFPLGFISFSNNSMLTDFIYTHLVGFDIGKIPLINEGVKAWSFDNCRITLNNEPSGLENVIKHRIMAKPPPGWIGHI